MSAPPTASAAWPDGGSPARSSQRERCPHSRPAGCADTVRPVRTCSAGREGAAQPIRDPVEPVQLRPRPAHDAETGIADGVLAALLGEDDLAGIAARPRQPAVLDPAVELAHSP